MEDDVEPVLPERVPRTELVLAQPGSRQELARTVEPRRVVVDGDDAYCRRRRSVMAEDVRAESRSEVEHAARVGVPAQPQEVGSRLQRNGHARRADRGDVLAVRLRQLGLRGGEG